MLKTFPWLDKTPSEFEALPIRTFLLLGFCNSVLISETFLLNCLAKISTCALYLERLSKFLITIPNDKNFSQFLSFQAFIISSLISLVPDIKILPLKTLLKLFESWKSL